MDQGGLALKRSYAENVVYLSICIVESACKILKRLQRKELNTIDHYCKTVPNQKGFQFFAMK